MPNLVKMPHRLDHQDMTCRVVVETPKGSRSKFDYDEESGLFELAGLLPEGMSFPLVFGFVPSTKGEDGDPLDVMVLHDEAVPIGTLLTVRLIGVIGAEQTEGDKTVRNDRLLAVTTCSHQHKGLLDIEALGKTFVDHLAGFWVNYNTMKGKGFEVHGLHGAERAASLVEAGSGADGEAAPETASQPLPETDDAAHASLGSSRTFRPIDPSDGVLPGVAVIEPEPLDDEARRARDALTSHLSGK